MAARALADEVHRVISPAVDGAFYRAAYPELDTPDLDPVRHYATAGWREGRDPAPWFSVRAYLEANFDVRRSGTEPFYHYLVAGRREGRDAYPSVEGERFLMNLARRQETHAWSFEAPRLKPSPAPAIALAPIGGPASDPAASLKDRALIAAEFDAAYYLAASPDVAAAGVDPIEHFLVTGWREGRDPNPRFSLQDYLESYPDIALAGVNPFVHYVRTGRAEGRVAKNELGFRYEVLAHLQPVMQRTAAIAADAARLRPDPAARLAKALAKSRTGLRDLHVTFSHDNYTANLGGVQLCVQREDARIAELGRDHLHLYPATPWPVVREAAEPGPLGVVWNGASVGAFTAKDVAGVLRKAAGAAPAGARSFAIHSLLGHSPDETAEILAAAGLKAGYFWLHDFASLCAGFHLLRNDVEDCAAPPLDSAACSVCAYLPYRPRHLAAHERLFELLDLTVVAPSEPTLQLWSERWTYPAEKTVILPHARLAPRGPAPVNRKKRPLRLAYVGLPVAHKGWPIFRNLALKHEGDPRYVFLHLGNRSQPGLPLEFHEVTVSEARPRIMQETLEALEVDAVLIWPLCRETFSFTAYEAAAAGCAIVTGPDSGNVAAFVQESGHGWVLPDEAALAAALDGGEIAELARARRTPMLHDLQFSSLTVDLLTRDTGP
jgi:hypothetical protein